MTFNCLAQTALLLTGSTVEFFISPKHTLSHSLTMHPESPPPGFHMALSTHPREYTYTHQWLGHGPLPGAMCSFFLQSRGEAQRG
jgi:hypothetical protein